MPNLCDHICQAGTEEQCSACLASQYAGGCTPQFSAIETAEKHNRVAAGTAAALRLYVETGEKMFRNALSVTR